MMKSYFQFFHYDKDQSYLRQTKRKRSRSFVQGFLKMQTFLFDQSVTLTTTDITGAGRDAQNSATGVLHTLRATGAGRGGGNFQSLGSWKTADSLGIILGTGSTAVAPTDYVLATPIADGTTSGTLEYFPSSGWSLSVSNPTGSFKLERLFRNSSGGTITIAEAGVYAVYCNNTPYSICIIRDLVSPTVAVLNGEYLRVVYTLTVTA